MRKGKDPDPDPYLWLTDPDPWGPKTWGSGGSGWPTLLYIQANQLTTICYWSFQTGARFSTKAVMPSFLSCVAKVACTGIRVADKVTVPGSNHGEAPPLSKTLVTRGGLGPTICVVQNFFYLWLIKSSRVVRASGCQCQSRNSPGFDPSILRHSGIWGAADDAVLNTVH